MTPVKPPYIARLLDLPALLARKSYCLFGPRRLGDVTILPLREFLEALWRGAYTA